MSTETAKSAKPESAPDQGAGANADRASLAKLLIPAGIMLSVVLAFGSFLVWWISGNDEFSPEERLALALEMLDEGRNYEARELARQLEAQGYRDPQFDGAVEYILGIVAFRSAEELDAVTRRAQYILAISYLKEAERRALQSERRPEWSYASGVSLSEVGLASEAQPLLEEAVETYPPGRVNATLMLGDTYLTPGIRSDERLQRALMLNETVTDRDDISEEQRVRALLQRAAIYLALDDADAAEQTIDQIASPKILRLERDILRAQIRMRQERFAEATQFLLPVASDARLNPEQSRRAAYLLGRAADLAGNHETAISHYERTIERYEGSDEAVAANLRMGRLLQRVGRNEEALGAYGQALKQVRRPADFHNDWLSLEEFREIVTGAWTDWLEEEQFMEAILLSELLSPLFAQDRAYEMAASAAEKWGETLAAEIERLPYERQRERQVELDKRWRQAGEQYTRLAYARRTSARYEDALWMAAQMYERGHDFPNALKLIDSFLKEAGEKRRAAALVERGEILLGLDRLEEATEAFQAAIETYPTDPVVYNARYLLGVSWLERDDAEQAAAIWRELLESGELTPAAREWRLALFALGRVLYHQTELLSRDEPSPIQQVSATAGGDASNAEQQQREMISEAVRLLNEYVERYPNSDEADEAEFLLAKSLQRVARGTELRLQSAETDNARQQLNEARRNTLEEALARLEAVRARLLDQFQAAQIDDLRQEILRNCYYEIPHTLFALERYQQAITAYSTAANRFPLEAQSLTAYVQMANCYDRLGRSGESSSMLEQAKVILKQIPDAALEPPATNLTRAEWTEWLDWAIRLRQ